MSIIMHIVIKIRNLGSMLDTCDQVLMTPLSLQVMKALSSWLRMTWCRSGEERERDDFSPDALAQEPNVPAKT